MSVFDFSMHRADWAERRDGHAYFKERLDFQVKIKGVRIDLDAVTAILRDVGWPVVCALRRDGALIDALAARLDAQVIPKAIHLIDQMPLNENGKIDRGAVAAWLDTAEAGRAGM